MDQDAAYRRLGERERLPFTGSLASTLTSTRYLRWLYDLLEDHPDRAEILAYGQELLNGQSTFPRKRTEHTAVNYSLLHSYPAEADLELVTGYHRLHDDFLTPGNWNIIKHYSPILEHDVPQTRRAMLDSGLIVGWSADTQAERVRREMLPMAVDALTRHGVPFEWAIQVDRQVGAIRHLPEMMNFYTAGLTPVDVLRIAHQIASHHEARDEALLIGMLRAAEAVTCAPEHAIALAVSGLRRADLETAAAEAADCPSEYVAVLYPPVPSRQWD